MKVKIIFSILIVTTSLLFSACSQDKSKSKNTKLYWFIPDGMRADPDLFKVFDWAREGKLPNIKRMIEEGSHGYSIPDFPSHTPTNFASLLTGTHPNIHGISDGPMHIEGRPLARPSVGGFSSTAKWVKSIWNIAEDAGKKVVLMSLPGSTPPELKRGITVRGRWGGWGMDAHKIVFESSNLHNERKKFGKSFKLFFLGSELTRSVDLTSGTSTRNGLLEGHGGKIPIEILDTDSDNFFDTLAFGKGQQKQKLIVGQWSQWAPIKLLFKGTPFQSQFKVKLMKLNTDGTFRLTVLFNQLNKFITKPGNIAQELTDGVGPMVDFPDNWPPQLVFEKEDKQTFFDEAMMALEWHRKAASFVLDKYSPDIFIQDTYTPNQMLESRWWHQYIDKTRKNYSPVKAEEAWKDIFKMYQGLDKILGEAMAKADENSIIALSSDHGVCSLHRLTRLNNLFAKKGWLKFSIDPKTGYPTINWKETKVVYLKMAHIYVNPNGLDGNWIRGKSEAYKKLRMEVKTELEILEDSNGFKPLARALIWEEAQDYYKLPKERIGDLVIETKPPYFWYEEVTADKKVFVDPLTSGFKQTVDSSKNNCMWTPFVIWGKGVKKGAVLDKPISHVDQLPTILKLLNIEAPKNLSGRVLNEILDK